MKFSKKFTQGIVVAVGDNPEIGSGYRFQLYCLKGAFILILKTGHEEKFIPYGKDGLNYFLNVNDGTKVRLVNGFTIADMELCLTGSQTASLFNLNGNNFASTSVLGEIPYGYIEHKEEFSSIEGQAILVKSAKYIQYLTEQCRANNVAVQSFNQFSVNL